MTDQLIKNRKFLFVTINLRLLISHRMHLLKRLRSLGNEVLVLGSGTADDADALVANGMKVQLLDVTPHKIDAVRDFRLIKAIRKAFLSFKPDVVNVFATKTMTLTKVALHLTKISSRPRGIVYSFAGLGRLFSPCARIGTRAMKGIFIQLMRMPARGTETVVTVETQNDQKRLQQSLRLSPDSYIVTNGTGIDTDKYAILERQGALTFLYAGRLLKKKGTQVYLDAVSRALQMNVDGHFLMAGFCVSGDPDALPRASLDHANSLRGFEFLGDVSDTDMPALLSTVDVVCLPSTYMEGIPRILLEACSSGCAYVTTRIPGWLEVTKTREDCGWFVDANSADQVAEIFYKSAQEPEKTREMGRQARNMILQSELGIKSVQRSYLLAYSRSLQPFGGENDRKTANKRYHSSL